MAAAMAFSPHGLNINLENCEYRGEGNANIVVRLIKEKKVMRLLKNASANSLDQSSIESKGEKLNIFKNYVKNIMQNLLGNFVADPEMIHISAKEVRIINQVLADKRPTSKLDLWLLEAPTVAFVLPDFCDLPQELSDISSFSSPVIAVEIKPKQGFISRSYEKPFPDVLQKVCRYCTKQSLKLKSNSVKKRSGYCPLDLYSGCPVRMSRALRELLKNPQNNLTIFKNQRLVFGGQITTRYEEVLGSIFDTQYTENIASNFVQVVVQALLHNFSNDIRNNSPLPEVQAHHCANVPVVSCVSSGRCPHRLPEGCVLTCILCAQMLGQSEVDLVYAFVKDRFPESKLYLDGSYVSCHIPRHMGSVEAHPSESEDEFLSRKVWEFLVSMTARDCSVMMVFQKVDNRSNLSTKHIVEDSDGNAYVTSVAIVDMDPKPIKRVEGVYLLNKEMGNSYLKSNQLA